MQSAWSTFVMARCCEGFNKEEHQAELLEGCVDALWMGEEAQSEQCMMTSFAELADNDAAPHTSTGPATQNRKTERRHIHTHLLL